MLKNFLFKNNFIYLILISILSYCGFYFVGNFFLIQDNSLFFKFIVHVILLLNSFFIYHISFKSSGNDIISLIISSLYLLSPVHFDVFFFHFQFQALLAESCFLIFYYSYMLDLEWGIFLGITCGSILNTKLAFALPLLCMSGKLSKPKKIMLLATFIIIGIYLIPKISKEFTFLSIGSFYSQIQLTLAPLNLTLFNTSILIPKFYSDYVISFLCLITFLTLTYLYFHKKQLPLVFLSSIALTGVYLPIIRDANSFNTHFLLLPTLYPTILLGILFLLLSILSEYKSIKAYLFISTIFACFWLLTNLNVQTLAQDEDNFWQYSLEHLPSLYNSREEVQYNYALFLINRMKFDEAEKLIRKEKETYPKIEWYHLLLKLVARKRDNEEINKIQAELITKKIPYMETPQDN